MTLNYVRQTLTSIAFVSLVLAGCNASGASQCDTTSDCPVPAECSEGRCIVVMSPGDAGSGGGCAQPTFPAGQPDMFPFFPPEFVTEDGDEQRQVRPGQELLAEVSVNADTRHVRVELADTFTLDRVILVAEADTAGNETIPLSFMTAPSHRGFFFMRVILCGANCNAQQVVFDLIEPDLDNQTETGINANYERTVIENGEVTQVDQTCIRPDQILVQ